MPQMIMHGGKLIRVCPKNDTTLEYSEDNGRTWRALCFSKMHFNDLIDGGKEILATINNGTLSGLYYSEDGRSWRVRRFN